MRRSLAIVLAAAAAALAPATARADDASVATELFNAGRDLMKRGEYAAACPKLAESVRLDATVGALAKLAACEEHEKRLVSARARWLQALNLARSQGDPRVGDVEAELARIDRVVPKVILTCAHALPDGAEIHVDDERLGPAMLGVAIAIEPGAHRIEVVAPERKPWSTNITASADGSTTPLTIPELASAAPAFSPAPARASSPAPTPAPTPDPPHSLSPAVITLASLGVVGVGVGSVFGFQAMQKKNDAGCNGTACPADANAATLDDAKHAATISTIGFIAGGALVAGATVLYFFGPPSNAPRVAPSVGANGGGVVVSGRF